MKENYLLLYKTFFRKQINTFISFILFLLSIFIIFINLKKIFNKDIIIIQNQRLGFGNTFTSIDLARKIFKNKKILFINFYDSSRFHNPKLFDFLNEEKIILYMSIYFKKRKSRFGEFDVYPKKNENYFQNILIKIILIIANKRTNSYDILALYQLASNKNKLLKKKKYNFISPYHQWVNYYYHLVEKDRTLKLNKKKIQLKKFIKSKDSKIICFYIREKKLINKVTQNHNLYFKLINFFFKNNYHIFLTGEYINLLKAYPEILKLVKLPEIRGHFDKEKNLAMQLSSNYYIGDAGGGSYFAMYKKKSIILGDHVGNFFPKNVKTFKYNLYKDNLKIQINKKYKKFFNKKIKFYKTSLDPFLLIKLGFHIRSYSQKSVLNYVLNNFKK